MSVLPLLTARGIVQYENSILLMERWRNGLHYFSIPGGHIEPNEHPENTVVREFVEETTVSIAIDYPIFEYTDNNYRHLIYLCTYVGGQPLLPLDSEESLRSNNSNRFKPDWVGIASLPYIPMGFWQGLNKPIVQGLQNGFSRTVKVVMAQANR
jgi:8-oxo-dGTP diphosphatase